MDTANMRLCPVVLFATSFFCAAGALAQPPSQGPDWRTPAEISGYRTTPDYAETVAYLDRIQAAYPRLVRIENFGKTGEGRELKIVIASKDGVFDPAAIHASGRVILLVQNSIHAGEMDGKDACLALLRDIVQDKNSSKRLLEHAVLVFIPVYNLDGHERRSPYTRINQNGPEQAGWRANATNLNLNRDYMKADAPETRAFLAMFHRWLPDFFVDDHVTDGMDYQYDVTFMLDAGPDVAAETAEWIRTTVTPELAVKINAAGHLAFPNQIYLKSEDDPAQGLSLPPNAPRFSTGQMILEDRPGLLVELHMLKDYKTRVTGNTELLRGLLEILNRDAGKLIALNQKADTDAAHPGTAPLPLAIAWAGQTTPIQFHGYQFTRSLSEISGSMWVQYRHEPWEATLPMETGQKVASSVTPPAAYLIPPQWTAVIDVLRAHQVPVRRTSAPWTGKVERYRCAPMQPPARSFEGRHPVLADGFDGPSSAFGGCKLSTETMTFPAGSVLVLLDNRLSKVAMHWLEPHAPDSALRWGFFEPIFEQKEYGEGYVLEKLAREMLSKDPTLKAEFEQRIESDPKFAASPWARLNFFYERSPWYQENRIGEYPVARLLSLEGAPLE
jgi:hypothetical protein